MRERERERGPSLSSKYELFFELFYKNANNFLTHARIHAQPMIHGLQKPRSRFDGYASARNALLGFRNFGAHEENAELN